MAKQSKRKTATKLLSKGVNGVSHLTRNNLERVGGLLDTVNAKTQKPQHFKAVDLTDYKNGNTDNLFRQETLKTSEKLLGSRFATYGKIAKKIVPESVFDKVSDTAFSQVAKLAATWSEIDLPNEQRFDGIQGLTEQQRNALASDIANQNRALAIMGSVTGLAGLPGLLADTLWLLLVSLRTVYQLARVYNKPLTGKQGVKMAYAVLSNADLSKMQEKQAFLAGLGVAQQLLGSADNRGLSKELGNIGGLAGNIQHYTDQIDKIASQFNLDIDDIDLSWLARLLPISSIAIGAYYNSHLIEQVIGTAKATFAPEPKMALADKSEGSEEDKQKKEAQTTDTKQDKDADTDASKNESDNDSKADDTTKAAKDTEKTKDTETDKDAMKLDKEDGSKDTAVTDNNDATANDSAKDDKNSSKNDKDSSKNKDSSDEEK